MIVINALQFKSNSSGIGILLRELFGRLARICPEPNYVVLSKNSPLFPEGKQTRKIYAPCLYEQGIKRILYQSFILGPKYCKGAIVIASDTKIPLLLPKDAKLVSVITDLAVFRMGEVYQLSRMLLWRMQYKYLCRKATRFIAISDFTKHEMVELLGIQEERITVIPCAAGDHIRRIEDKEEIYSFRRKYNIPERVILFVGNANPRKNLDRLVMAYDRLKKETDLPHELVIAGGMGWKFDRNKALDTIENKGTIHFIDYIPDDEMSLLYSSADLYVFPTLYEGFGIPVIEAQKCGIPVLTSNITSLPEVAGDGAFYIDPYDVSDIKRGMKAVLQDNNLRNRLIQQGYKNASRYSWDKSAELLLNTIV